MTCTRTETGALARQRRCAVARITWWNSLWCCTAPTSPPMGSCSDSSSSLAVSHSMISCRESCSFPLLSEKASSRTLLEREREQVQSAATSQLNTAQYAWSLPPTGQNVNTALGSTSLEDNLAFWGNLLWLWAYANEKRHVRFSICGLYFQWMPSILYNREPIKWFCLMFFFLYTSKLWVVAAQICHPCEGMVCVHRYTTTSDLSAPF